MRLYAILAALCIAPFAADAAAPLDIQTGPRTGTYYTFGKDIAAIAKQADITLNVHPSEGSVDNIRLLHQSPASSLAIVQSDVLGFLSRSNNPALPEILSRMRVVFPLYMEEVHVLARKEIHEFKDLQGKKVAVGEEASGHMLTSVNLFSIEQIVPAEIRKITPEEGVVEVLRGNLDAVVLVGGKPLRIFKNMEDLNDPVNRKFRLLLDHVHFLPMNSAKFYEEYEPTEIIAGDYDFVKSTVPTIAVQSILVSLEAGNGTRCGTLKKLTASLRNNIATIKETGHPKWAEVNFNKEVTGWKKDNCAWTK